MTANDLPNTGLKFGLALAKHHIKNVIGDEALQIVANRVNRYWRGKSTSQSGCHFCQ